MAAKDLTEYERRRQENIKRNAEMMASLMLQRKAADLSTDLKRSRTKSSDSSPSSKKPKPVRTSPVVIRRSLRTSPVVIRRSLRSRGIPPDSSLHQSEPPPSPTPLSPPLPARKRGPIHMEEAYVGTQPLGQELVSAIMDMSDDAPFAPSKPTMGSSDWDPRSSMVLRQENVKRFMTGKILSVGFFPFQDRTVIAAGDKVGHVGFWDVDYREGEGDGVYVYAPHSSPVSGILIQPDSLSKIFTSSYDGFIRLMDVQKETFNLIYSSDDAIYSIRQKPNIANPLYFGEGYGGLKVWDERAGKLSSSWVLHDSRINTIDFNPENTNLMATSSTDGTACIWDLRSIKHKKPTNLTKIQHKKAVHAAYFSPSGSYLATTSLDNHVGIVGADFNGVSMISHNNHTGRWISSFRAIWGWDDTHLFMGNMTRAVDIISTASKDTISLESPHMTAIPCRFAAHPYKVGSLACATAGGQVYLWTKK